MLINQVAKKYNITIRTLRYYEEIGLLKSSRNESNIRTYDNSELQKLDQIIIYKMLNFSLIDIKDILTSSNNEALNDKLYNKLTLIDSNIHELTHKQQLLRSLLKTFGSNDISKQTVQEFISEQIYFNNKNERLVAMLTSTENIVIEIGKYLIPIVMNENSNSLISAIKQLRQSLSNDYSIAVETMRIRDNTIDLKPNEYRILQNNNLLIKKTVKVNDEALQVEHIISNLKSILL